MCELNTRLNRSCAKLCVRDGPIDGPKRWTTGLTSPTLPNRQFMLFRADDHDAMGVRGERATLVDGSMTRMSRWIRSTARHAEFLLLTALSPRPAPGTLRSDARVSSRQLPHDDAQTLDDCQSPAGFRARRGGAHCATRNKLDSFFRQSALPRNAHILYRTPLPQ